MKQKETVSVPPTKRHITHVTFENCLHAITSSRLIAHGLADDTVLPFAEFRWNEAMRVRKSRVKSLVGVRPFK